MRHGQLRPAPCLGPTVAAFWDTLMLLLVALPRATLCLGDPVPRDCLPCLTAAAKKLTGCGASRRAGVWSSEGWFLAYADSNTSSANKDAFRDDVSFGEVYPAVISVDDDDGTTPSNLHTLVTCRSTRL
uniref:Uncharacterized protein n=1 Tax=Aegilops tauschii TaxID=37682 RepID=M8C2H4_AEGTA